MADIIEVMPGEFKVTLLDKSEIKDYKNYLHFWPNEFSVLTNADFKCPDYSKKISLDSGYVLTKNQEGPNKVWVYDIEKKKSVKTSIQDSKNMILPVLELSEELFDKFTNYGKQEKVTFGHYACWAEGRISRKLMERKYKSKNADKINMTYTFADRDGYGQHYIYKFMDLNYIRIKANTTKPVKLEGRTYKAGDYAWFWLSSLNWHADKKNHRLICERPLLSGIPYDTKEENYGDFEDTSLYRYLNETLIYDLFKLDDRIVLPYRSVSDEPVVIENNTTIVEEPIIEETQETETEKPKETEIQSIVKEIVKLTQYYLGDDNVQARVDELVKKYNSDVQELSRISTSNNMELQIGFKDLNMLYNDLINDLNVVLDRLKSDYEKTKPYYEMIDLLTHEANGELPTFLAYIRGVLNNKLLEKDSTKLSRELTRIINKHVKKCNKGILEVKSGKQNESLEVLIDNFRSDLQPFLVKLNDLVEKKNIVKEILEGIRNIINNQYKECNDERVKYYLNIIKESRDVINRKGNDSDKEKLEQLLDFSIDYSKDILTILKELADTVKSVYRIELDIKERKQNEGLYDQSMVNIDVNSLFKSEEIQR